MATTKYSAEARTLSEAGFPVLVNSRNNWHLYIRSHAGGAHTVPRHGCAPGLQRHGNREGWAGQLWEGHSQTQVPPNRTFPRSNSALWELG